jgi:hypothetical protein
MSDETVSSPQDGPSRRAMLKTVGAGTALLWAAPAVTAVAHASTSTSIPINTHCNGTDCSQGQVAFCNDAETCFCYEQFGTGTGLCETNQSCANLAPCPNGQGDCPGGTVCAANTCCGATPVCLAITGQCPTTTDKVHQGQVLRGAGSGRKA